MAKSMKTRIKSKPVDPKVAKKVKVKLERLRMSRRKKHKKGFYNQGNLESIAWKGKGTEADPVMVL